VGLRPEDDHHHLAALEAEREPVPDAATARDLHPVDASCEELLVGVALDRCRYQHLRLLHLLAGHVLVEITPEDLQLG